ncbi:hypothetical protein [[Ruminococcus] torques]|uniref:hypothetical protein n=1 Tax=[Ruminococcus] torques TaxID=33039 RepID=UPI003AB92ACF
MVIHTKEKAEIHSHEPKKAEINGSNIYTVQRDPRIASTKVNDNTDKKKIYRKSTVHQAEKKEKGLSKFKRNIRESKTSIKTKNTNLHIAGRPGALAAGAVTEQVEGGQEVSQAAYLAYEVSRPVTGTASRGASLFRKKAVAEVKKRIKKVEAGKKLAKKTVKKAASNTAKTAVKETDAGTIIADTKKGEMKYPGFTHVICAVGSKAWNPLYEEIKDTYETYVIGDAKEVAQALEAVRGAYELGYRL